jgi:RNA polymerase sigma-70 factor, ECF subfamily
MDGQFAGWIEARNSGSEPATELALLCASQGGDPVALECLLAPHKEPLLVLCLGILGHPDDAEDAAQETLLRALRALERFRGDASFRTWVFRIAINVCLNWKRDQRPVDLLDETRPAGLPDTASPETVALRHLELQEALQALRPHHRVVLLLKEREGWSVPEIGLALRWNKKRVENELYRARRALVDWRRAREGGEE